ncbi:unnamed protein product, partial [Amoebophrya sp. A120]
PGTGLAKGAVGPAAGRAFMGGPSSLYPKFKKPNYEIQLAMQRKEEELRRQEEELLRLKQEEEAKQQTGPAIGPDGIIRNPDGTIVGAAAAGAPGAQQLPGAAGAAAGTEDGA